jgi:hypothetical protein
VIDGVPFTITDPLLIPAKRMQWSPLRKCSEKGVLAFRRVALFPQESIAISSLMESVSMLGPKVADAGSNDQSCAHDMQLNTHVGLYASSEESLYAQTTQVSNSWLNVRK